MPGTTQKKMHLPLSEDLHARLKEAAEAQGAPTTALAREAIEQWLDQRRRKLVAQELRAYAVEAAGTDVDLDEDFEAAGVERLLDETS